MSQSLHQVPANSLPALVGTRREAIKCRVEIQDDTIATTKGDEKLILQKMAFKDRLGGAALEQRSRSLATLGSPAGAESGEKN
jgi:hypothetical protein